MKLRQLSDNQLDQNSVEFARQEREILTKVLHHLRENEARRLFSARGYKSLFEYAVKRLGYSEDQAARRISAMRLLKELPEIEEKIESGSLNLTNLGMAQTLFRQEKKISAPVPKQSKLQLLAQLENKSTRDAEKIVLAASSAPRELMPDRTRAVSAEQSEMRLLVPNELQPILDELRALLAHSAPNCSTGELLVKVCKVARSALLKAKSGSTAVPEPKPAAMNFQETKSTPARRLNVSAPAAPQKHRGIPAHIKREVWRRADCKCQSCGSQYALQIDHIVPVSLGGDSASGNLRLLCRSCNQRAAIEMLGRRKMENFLKSPVRRYG